MPHQSSTKYASLRKNVSDLGRILGEVIALAEGDDFLAQIEKIRLLSKDSRSGSEEAFDQLQALVSSLDEKQLVPVARAFSQFLNLANIADQHFSISREMDNELSALLTLEKAVEEVSNNNDRANIVKAIDELSIELVLTAHPTEITRRSHIHKYAQIDQCLSDLELDGRTERETLEIHNRLRNLITQLWYSHDFRSERPTPVDEAIWGFAVIENSLWNAVPEFIRRLDKVKRDATGEGIDLRARPVKFTSWMGGDRDGNPNVTAKITERVLLLSRWKAIDLYHRAVNALVEEMSMTVANDELKNMAGSAREPYRAVLRNLRSRLADTLKFLKACLDGEKVSRPESCICHEQELWIPIHACYQSLIECGMHSIAEQQLLGLLRQIRCFGVTLVQHDLRQESGRHEEVFQALTQALNLGDYATWEEDQKQTFLLAELSSERPLFPRNWQPSADIQEVIDTCRVAAKQDPDVLASYIISMARHPSDILEVQLLLKECGCNYQLPVAPLFETLDDLRRAPSVIERLLSVPGYKELIENRLLIMIGYSDSAKDAGVLAASWAQYCAQESLVQVCDKTGVHLTLFHGRGGTIGRGGAPAHDALLSQPPGSLKGGLRVTEQGEMIRTKLGDKSIAVKTLALYSAAILRANLCSPPKPEMAWREIMNQLADDSCEAYRDVVRVNPDFVPYFRQATPEQELANLPLGSRPARRKSGGGIESLRAIPWIFAWSQNRLMLPAWLGAGIALQKQLDAGKLEILQGMASKWPFFATRLSMLEMVFAKADLRLSKYYDDKLVEADLKGIGQDLRIAVKNDINTILTIVGRKALLEDQVWGRDSIELRNIYTDPLNLLQAELLKRSRHFTNRDIEDAIMVTIAGVAAGMRNTG
jgi:phosphoenolpyruvate carboxylase